MLAFLVVRALKQRRALAHHRLSDPALDEHAADAYVGARPENQEFDRDSVGGQRRRSFYFAADSLRGAETNPMQDEYSAHAPAMRQRVQPGAAISGPYLRENTMNW